jgi:hypothetical protein
MASKICPVPGCPEVTKGGRCAPHKAELERQRGTRQQRGYDLAHDRERKRVARLIRRGGQHCARCQLELPKDLPSDAWHLDHNADRTGYLGPSHTDCNLAAAGRAAHQVSP